MNGLRRNDDAMGTGAGIQKEPSVAVVILNWNGKKFLEQFLPSVLHSTYENLKIVVADNASEDGSEFYLVRNYPNILVIPNGENLGFARGYNLALKQVLADYYILLNSDVEVSPGWIEPVIELMEKDKSIAACQPKVLSYNRPDLFEYAGACGGWIDTLGYPFARGRIFDICEEDNKQYDQPSQVFWATGAAMFVRAQLFHENGGFDNYFFAHQEEIDLCWRLQLAGYKIYVQPRSVVYHVGGGTLPRGNSLKTYLNFRNNLIMITKNEHWYQLIWKIPVRLALDATSAWKSLLKGDAGYFKTIWKAHIQYIKWLMLEKSESVYPLKKKARPYGIYRGSVVWQYFVRGKKRFSEIVGNKA